MKIMFICSGNICISAMAHAIFVKMIKETNPDVILVAHGNPLQEKLINRHINEFKKGIFVGVGGSIDDLSESIRSAPNIFIKTNTEFL